MYMSIKVHLFSFNIFKDSINEDYAQAAWKKTQCLGNNQKF